MSVPDYGVSARDSTDYDDEYVERMSRKPRDLRPYYNSKIPIAEIRRLLQYRDVNDELQGVSYMRARMEDRVSCPLCSNFQHWNRQYLLEHLRSHNEVQGFLDGVVEEQRRNDGLFDRREKLKEELQKMKDELRTVEDKIRKIDRPLLDRRQQEYDELFRLLYGSAA